MVSLCLCHWDLPEWQLHQPRLWFITGGYLVKRWFIPAAATARGQSNDLNRGILASNLFNCHKEVINAPPVPSISRCIHIVYRHKNVCKYQWSNFIYNCMSTFLHYVRCKDALLDRSDPGGERCESLTWVDEITFTSYFVFWLLWKNFLDGWFYFNCGYFDISLNMAIWKVAVHQVDISQSAGSDIGADGWCHPEYSSTNWNLMNDRVCFMNWT